MRWAEADGGTRAKLRAFADEGALSARYEGLRYCRRDGSAGGDLVEDHPGSP